MRPPYETFKRPTCRGCYALGTACGKCEKCEWELIQAGLGDAPPKMFGENLKQHNDDRLFEVALAIYPRILGNLKFEEKHNGKTRGEVYSQQAFAYAEDFMTEFNRITGQDNG